MATLLQGPMKVTMASMSQGVKPRSDVPWKIRIESMDSEVPAPPPGLSLPTSAPASAPAPSTPPATTAAIVKSPPPGLEEVVLAALSPEARKESSSSSTADDDELASTALDNASEDQSWEELYCGLTGMPEQYYPAAGSEWWTAPGMWQSPMDSWVAGMWGGEAGGEQITGFSWWGGLDPTAVEENDDDDVDDEDQTGEAGDDAAKGKKKKKTRSRKSAAKKVQKKLSLASESTAADGEDAEKDGAKEETWTTVMMRNVPNDFTGTMLIDLLNREGFYSKYNLVYLPMDYHRKAGFGYAFIDLVSTEEAIRFREHFQGFSNWGLVSHKVCEVGWSDALQGVQAHIDRYRNSPVMHSVVPDEFKPMLFSEGERIAFPTPTKSVRAPRLRKKDPRLMSQKMPRRLTATPTVPEAEACTADC